MNVKEMATFLEEELQSVVHIDVKVAKSDYALLDVEDEDGNSFVLRITPVKNVEEAGTDSTLEDAGIDEEDESDSDE